MTAMRFLTAIFCDDVRREEGNKLSYMGIYNANLQVPTFPHVLPKLCVAMTMHCRSGGPIPGILSFNLYMDNVLLAELPIDMAGARNVLAHNAGSAIGDEEAFTAMGVLQVFPLNLTAPCQLLARAQCDGEEFRGGILRVEASR